MPDHMHCAITLPPGDADYSNRIKAIKIPIVGHFSREVPRTESTKASAPPPDYPACPDNTAKGQIFRVLDAEKTTGVTLTESYAMSAAAAVRGSYLAHPKSLYFAVSKIAMDQVNDWAARSGQTAAYRGGGEVLAGAAVARG